MLVNRAPLCPHAIPDGGECLLEPGCAVHDEELRRGYEGPPGRDRASGHAQLSSSRREVLRFRRAILALHQANLSRAWIAPTGLVGQRTSLTNQIRSILLERGIVAD